MSEQNFGQELLHTPGGVRDIYGAECASRFSQRMPLPRIQDDRPFEALNESRRRDSR